MTTGSPSPSGNRLAAAWFGLALSALGLSALFALALVVARTPFLAQGASFFRTALVLHVDLAVWVWFLAMAAGIWSLQAGAAGWFRWTLLILAALGTLAMLASPLGDGAIPILTNYLPIIDHPFFATGLIVFVLAAAATGLALLPSLRNQAQRRERLAPALAVAALLVSVAVLLIDITAPSAADGGPAGIDSLLWGTGHAVQFVHVLLMMGAWHALAGELAAHPGWSGRAFPWLLAVAFLPVLGAPAVALLHPAGTVEHRAYFTELMRWGSWPGAAILGLALVARLMETRQQRALSLDEKALALSIFLFGAGCLAGTAIHGESLAVPAHYHGTVGAVTLAYLAWLRRMSLASGTITEWPPLAGRLPLHYGFGIAILVAGLSAAGAMGIPRKAPHADIAADSGAYFLAMGAAGIGGFIALTAVAIYVMAVFRAAAGFRPERPTAKRDRRLAAIVLTLALVLGGGWLIQTVRQDTDRFSARRHAAEKIRADIDRRFEQGVIMLHAKQYDHALTAFHRVLQLAPEMPEAYVNTGFALIGLKRYKEARDFFESATLLRRSQVNAYYGLAVALEGMGDIPGALGAMQSFIHLTKADDPFRRKAEAAVWEWRQALEGQPHPAPPR